MTIVTGSPVEQRKITNIQTEVGAYVAYVGDWAEPVGYGLTKRLAAEDAVEEIARQGAALTGQVTVCEVVADSSEETAS